MDATAALRPLDEAADAIRRLHEYETLSELGTAVDRTWIAVDRSLRLLLRSDSEAPEAHRMSALSPDGFTIEEVIQSLRSRDRISIELAGSVHQLRAAGERGAARPADADAAIAAVAGLRRELRAASPGGSAAPEPDTGPEAPEPGSEPPPEPVVRGTGRWMGWLGAGFAFLFIVALVWVFARGADREYEAAVQAFRSGRLDSAAVGFERVVQDQPTRVSALLYLGRVYRRQLRHADAAVVLRTAAAESPDDADVRRELGHLFMDLGQPASAARQYERALEQEPDEVRNWAGLIRALRAQGDPRAEQLLRDAPPAVRDILDPPGG